MSTSTVSIGSAARILGLSPSRVRQLSDAGVLSSTTTPGGHRRYDPVLLVRQWQAHRMGAQPVWSGTYSLPGLDESDVWQEARASLPEETTDQARRILVYAVTEMVNNAIDHSAGTRVTISMWRVGDSITVQILDDGVGAFARMAEVFGLPSVAAAVVEISKGKRTTAPRRHSGEGIFFTSKAVDVFKLAANGYQVVFDNLTGEVAFGQSLGAGTLVVLKLALASVRDLAGVFREFTNEEGDFDRSTPRVELAALGGDLMSRSEARRLAAGLEQFDRVVLDFTGVELIGQGFADELFRVWHRDHPSVLLQVTGANAGVELMINRV